MHYFAAHNLIFAGDNMKGMVFFVILTISATSFADSTCESLARRVVLERVTKHNRNFQVESLLCRLASNKKVQLCDVGGSNGDGAGDKRFLVVLSANCKHVYAATLTEEE